MNVRVINILLAMAFLSSTLFAQNDQEAVKVLDKAASAYNKAGGVYVEFTVDSENKRTKEIDKFTGSIMMKGAKSYLKTEEAEIWYDGKNQWALYHSSGEVNLSIPGPTEMEVYNPSVLFKVYKKSFQVNYVGKRSYGGNQLEVVELRPLSGNTNVIKITCKFTSDMRLYSVEVQNKNLTEVQLTINKYEAGKSYPDATFVFDKGQYPDIEIIDLRE